MQKTTNKEILVINKDIIIAVLVGPCISGYVFFDC